MLAVDYYFFTVFKIMLKLTSHDIMHYLWSADLSKSFSQLIVSIDCVNIHLFPIFFNRFYWVEKCGVTPTLLISWFINFNKLNWNQGEDPGFSFLLKSIFIFWPRNLPQEKSNYMSLKTIILKTTMIPAKNYWQ